MYLFHYFVRKTGFKHSVKFVNLQSSAFAYIGVDTVALQTADALHSLQETKRDGGGTIDDAWIK